MITAMFLAHLVGDYILQWDQLAAWKAREVKGAVAHGFIVFGVTVLFALSVNPAWWAWAVLIGGAHILIDGVQPWLARRLPLSGPGLIGLTRLTVDQCLHASVIIGALVASGYTTLPSLGTTLIAELQHNRWAAISLGYVFSAMPAWILVEFMAYGFVQGCAPDFPQAVTNKYTGTLERWLIATFVMLGQFGLVPLVALPRVVFEAQQVIGTRRATLYVTELLASVALAVAIGLGLKQIF